MKSRSLKLIVTFLVVLVTSCEEPETVVTDIVHTDGSVTRIIEMKNFENKFKTSNLLVPFDSTWTIKDSIEIDKDGDTTWVKRAEKLFPDIDGINLLYRNDSGANRRTPRRVEFHKSFRWFSTEYRFAEVVDKTFSYGYPVSDFLNRDELNYFYSPANIRYENENGPDSLKYRAIKDSANIKLDIWNANNLVSEWMGEFEKLTRNENISDSVIRSLRLREKDFVSLMLEDNDQLDSLWENGILLNRFLGRYSAFKYKPEADSAIDIVSERLFKSFHEYTVKIVMPGAVVGTNGFQDSSKILQWPVKSDFFLTEPYVMYADSRIPNKRIRILSAAFLLFVIAGMIFKTIKKG